MPKTQRPLSPYAADAVALGATTVDIVLHADALRDLGRVLVALGREQEAGPPFREALERYEQKGVQPAADSTRRLLSAVSVG